MTVLTTLQTTTPRRPRLGVACHARPAVAPWVAGAAGSNYWVRVIDFALCT